MTELIDLSHDFADGMPGFVTTLPDGSRLRCTAGIRLLSPTQNRGATSAATRGSSASIPGTSTTTRMPSGPQRLLACGIFIVWNLRNLAALGAVRFHFFAVPIKARGAASIAPR